MKILSIPKTIITITTCLLIVLYPAAYIRAADESSSPPTDSQTQVDTTSSQPEQSPDRGPRTTPGPKSDTGPRTTPGPKSPTGPDAASYTFNKDTGLWESDNYTWDPATGKTAPRQEPTYAFVPETSTWASDDYAYNPTTGKYEPIPEALKSASLAHAPDDEVSPALKNSSIFTGNSVDNSSSTLTGGNNFFDLFTKPTVTNYLKMISSSGDASVDHNTLAGDATTGPARVMANIMNLIHSVWNLTGGKLVTFFNNIFGNVSGDITIDPQALTISTPSGTNSSLEAAISDTGPGSTNTIGDNQSNNLTVNANQSGQIDNSLDLSAQSGNANVTSNSQGGSASSGDASVNLNLMNMIDSAIASGNSFFGVLNVFGDFLGNVLFPQGFLDGLVAGGSSSTSTPSSGAITTTGTDSVNQINSNQNNSANLTENNASTINNNISSQADSGAASVDHNTSAGSANSGNSDSTLTLLNLTGQNVIGDNAILVLVNVLGHWVGMIMNAPAGSNSAVLGKNTTSAAIANTGPDSQNSIDSTSGQTTNITNNSASTINNDINLNAKSGDATVADNTLAGNATSGNASTSANIVNLIGSQLSLTHWFGILFINIFGDWIGGVTTASPSSAAGSVGGSSNPAAASQAVATSFAGGKLRVFRLGALTGASNIDDGQTPAAENLILGAANSPTDPPVATPIQAQAGRTLLPWIIFAASLLLISVAAFAYELRDRRARRLQIYTEL